MQMERMKVRVNEKKWGEEARIKAVFREEGRSELLKRMDKGIKATIVFRKKNI